MHFFATASSACAVVVHRRRVLLIERAIRPYRGHWGFPGGFQDHGESLAETAVRETREEAGIDVRVERVLHVDLTRDDPRKLVNVVLFLARPIESDDSVDARLCAADDARSSRFFGFDELPSQIAFDVNRRVLDDLRSRYPDGDVD
ncbi:MAG: NUDIX hydrolase [Planctomycetota bacterium]